MRVTPWSTFRAAICIVAIVLFVQAMPRVGTRVDATSGQSLMFIPDADSYVSAGSPSDTG